MPQTTYITFRGEPDVEIEYSVGRYESDTNCQEVMWQFTDPAMKDIEPTPEEDEAVIVRLVEMSEEPQDPFWD